MKRILLAFCLIATGIFTEAQAQYITPPTLGECRNTFNAAVPYYPLTSKRFRQMYPGKKFAISTPMGILYDAQDLARFPIEFQQLVLWHECAHQALGHVPPSAAHTGSSHVQIEREADCLAAKKAIRVFTPEQFEKAMAGLRMSGKEMAGSLGHDSAKEREELSRSCAASP